MKTKFILINQKWRKVSFTENILYNPFWKENNNLDQTEWEKTATNPSSKQKVNKEHYKLLQFFLMRYDWMTGRDLLSYSLILLQRW